MEPVRLKETCRVGRMKFAVAAGRDNQDLAVVHHFMLDKAAFSASAALAGWRACPPAGFFPARSGWFTGAFCRLAFSALASARRSFSALYASLNFCFH